LLSRFIFLFGFGSQPLSEYDIVILGGGFSGTMLAVHLLRQSHSLSIAVMEPRHLPGRGLAYSSPYKFHLLNVPAGEMSALPDDPDDFLRWARVHIDAGMKERSFPTRSSYGAYVGDLLEKTRSERRHERFEWLRNKAWSLRRRRGGLAIQTDHGPDTLARVVVLATGNFPPANPRIDGLETPSAAYFPFPWSPDAVENLRPTDSVLLLGSGLTSLDLIMALKSKGFRGTIHVLSRKGLFPSARRQLKPVEPWPVFWNERSPRTVRGLLKLIRSQVRVAADKGIDWRAVIDSLRPVAQDIWRSLPIREKKRFLRHVREYWDVHRHRAAPEISDVLADMQSDGHVRLHTGILNRYSQHSEHAEILYWDRKTQAEKTLRVTRVINCTGSESDCRRIDDSLIVSLFVQGLARPDPLLLGLDVEKHGGLIDHKGFALRSLYAIGPLRKGILWETTTVSEIRQQAVELARHLVQSLEGTGRRSSCLKTAV
jgi:uncharacterized NAD(P)/FAD-binding protein YdhS